MGVRAKRRLVVGTIAVLIIAAGAAALLATRSGRPSPDSPKQSKRVYGTFGAFGIPYGLNRDQLAARVGEPVQKRNGCWTYRVQGGKFAGTSIPASIGTINAVRFCFFSGGVAIINDHWLKVNGRDPYGHPWVPPVTFGCGGGPCHLSQTQ